MTEKVLERVRRIATGTYTDEMAQLTAQEQKILLLVAEGKTNKEIAAEVFLSDKTVKNYVSSILSKLNLERRAQAAAFVAKHRLRPRRRRSRAPDGGRPRRLGPRAADRDDRPPDRPAGPGDGGLRRARDRTRSSSRPGSPDAAWGLNLLTDPGLPGHDRRRRWAAVARPLEGPEHAAAVRDLILRYGTPAESLGSGPAFELRRAGA